MSSKSPVMAKSFAIPSTNANNYLNQSSSKQGGGGNTTTSNGKAGSIGYQKRVSDFDNPLTSNTVDLTHLGAPGLTGNTQKDNQMLYKMMFQGGAGRHQKNLASSYLRGIDNQLRGGNTTNA